MSQLLINKSKEYLMEKLYKLNVIVYSGGKTGGTTLNNTFNLNGFNSLHVHSNYYFQTKVLKNNNISIFDVINYNCKKRELYIIDSYRTPIERKISSFFENIIYYLPNYNEYSVNQLIDIFNDKYFYTIEEYHPFDELKQYYGYPDFTEFDFNKKYSIITTNNITFIKIRFNEINNWSQMLEEIFGQQIIIHNENLTANKTINQIYNEFKNNYKVPDKYLDEILPNDKNFLLFNSKAEQYEYIRKWTNKRQSIQQYQLQIKQIQPQQIQPQQIQPQQIQTQQIQSQLKQNKKIFNLLQLSNIVNKGKT